MITILALVQRTSPCITRQGCHIVGQIFDRSPFDILGYYRLHHGWIFLNIFRV
jgi:hypothetical protein